jgi:hypothetical protein
MRARGVLLALEECSGVEVLLAREESARCACLPWKSLACPGADAKCLLALEEPCLPGRRMARAFACPGGESTREDLGPGSALKHCVLKVVWYVCICTCIYIYKYICIGIEWSWFALALIFIALLW